MSNEQKGSGGQALTPTDRADGKGKIWPSEGYARQVERLRAAVGQEIYIVEVRAGDINLSVRLLGRPYVLLAVIDFPRPDPERRNFPHMIVLDDGRGLNLGWIARVSVKSAFRPPEPDILYQEPILTRELLYSGRRLTKASLAARSKAILGRLLGKPPGRDLE